MKASKLRFRRSAGLLVGVVLAQVCFTNPSFSQAPFYKGKTITVVAGTAPGGTGDMRVRAVTPFLQKYIPGNPTVVIEYMDGGGGRKAANHIYAAARPDGLTIGSMSGAIVGLAVVGETGVKYDINKLIYLGSSHSANHSVLMTLQRLGLNSVDKLRAYSGLRIGAQSVGHISYINGRLFAWILGLKDPRFITGYSGPEVDVALLRGEVDGRALAAASLLRRNPEWVEKKEVVDLHAIVEIPKGDKHPRLAHLPELESFAKLDLERKVLAMHRALQVMGSPYILPPGTPRERVEILQEAFGKTFRNPEFLREYQRTVVEDPTPFIAEAMEKAVRELPRDSEIIELFKRIAGPGPLPPR